MAYTKTNWENSPSTNTPLNANNLNKIENELEYLDEKVTDTGWINLTPTSPATTESWNNLRYRKKNGIIYINGIINFNQEPSFSTVLATLPQGFRPSAEIDVCCRTINSSAITVLAISTNGNIAYLSSTNEGISENSGVFIEVSFIPGL